MRNLSLPLCGKCRRPCFSQTAVHVPLHIGNVAGGQQCREAFKQIVYDLPAGEIQNILTAALDRRSVRRGKHPVRMRAVQIAVDRDHFRLDPDAKLHAERIDAPAKLRQAAFDFFFVDIPVAKAAGVAVAFTKPAVVKNKQFDAKRGRMLRDLQELFVVIVEVGGLPAVQQHRASALRPDAMDDVVIQKRVKLTGKLPEACGGIRQQYLRCSEYFAGAKLPRKALQLNACDQTRLVNLVNLCGDQEAAAVDQNHRISLAGVFGCVVCTENRTWIVMQAGRAACAFYTKFPVL